MKSEEIQLDIIVPVYNEGRPFLRVLEALKREVKSPFRVVVCYDREDDTTLVALKEWPGNGFEIRTVRNEGRGAHGAVMTGLRTSRAPAMIFLPADDDYNAGLIDRMVAEFQAGADLVCASRFMPGGTMKGCPWLKAVLVRVANFTLYHAARLPTRDATNGFRLFSRRVVDRVRIESNAGFAFSLEYLVKCHRLGWRVREIPAGWYEREHGESRFRVLRWLPEYLRWYAYAFVTTYFRLGPETVPLRPSDDA